MKINSVTRKFGKMIRLDVTYSDHIETIKITGDFFLHPEDTLDLIVLELTGASIPIQKERLIKKINLILHNQKAEIIGVTAEELITTLEEATQ